jgi:hypothetical protein
MKKSTLALTLMVGIVTGVQAGIIESDDFTYNDGPVAQPTANVSNPASTWFANTGSAAGKEIVVSNNTLLVTGVTRTEDMEHTLVGFPYQTNGPVTALYSRYTLNCQGVPSSSGTYFSHFSGTNAFLNGPPNISGFRARVWASNTNLVTGAYAGDGQFFIGIVNSGVSSNNISLGNTNYCWPTPLSTNTTYTIVTRYVLATGTSTLWVNPSAEGSPSVTDTNVLPIEPLTGPPTNGIMAIDCYGFRQASGGPTVFIDGLRIGTIFADVAGNNQSPAISSVANQAIPASTNTGPISFTVEDPETVSSGLTVTATSSNTGLVPNGSPNIVLGSAPGGTNRTVTITPVAGGQGVTTITLSVSDSVNTSVTTFNLTVGSPSIGAIPNVQVYSNTPVPVILLTVSDAENDTLTFTKTSSNPTLVSASDMVFGSSGSISNLTITPEPNQIGITTITISVSDGHTTNSTSFVLTVSPIIGVVYNENFAYDDFSNSGIPNALYGAVGGSGGPWGHVSGPLYELQVTNVNVTSGLAYIVGTNNEDLGADFIGSTVYQGTNGLVFYTSFTVNCSFLPSGVGDYFFHLAASGADSSGFHDKIWANKANAATNKFRLGVSNVGAEVQNARDLSVGGTYVVVSKYNAGTGQSTLWVNPVNEQSASVVATDTQGATTIGGVALRQSSGTGDLAIGPMKVGTRFSDVFTAPAWPTLTYTTSGGNIILSWNNPLFVLQSATNVNGPYTDLAFTSPSTNAVAGNQFFRLKY